MISDNTNSSSHGSGYNERHIVPARVGVLSPFGWLLAGWRMFAKAPFTWVFISIVVFALLCLVSLFVIPRVPVVGYVLGPVAFLLLTGGVLYMAHEQADGAPVQVMSFVQGLREHPVNLIAVGVLYSIPIVVLSLLVYLADHGGILKGVFGSYAGHNGAVSSVDAFLSGLVASLDIILPAFVVMILALLHAPSLIMFRRCSAFGALMLSLRAFFKNFFPTLILGMLIGALVFLASLPAAFLFLAFEPTNLVGASILLCLGLCGFLVLMPVVIGTLHRAYSVIFGQNKEELAS